jgi:putative transposase
VERQITVERTPTRFQTQAEARMALFEWIEGWHNPQRRHSSIG